MRKYLVMALLAVVVLGANAEEKKEQKSNANKPVFTTVKENKITSIKNQSRSGTCWDYSTLSFLESEILKKTGKTYDLCEAFVANKTYLDRAVQVVRLHGDCQFAQGGSAYDPIYCLKHYGICPEDAMPLPGTLYGDSLNNFNEFFDVMTPYVQAIAKSKTDKLSTQWKVALQGILDAYLGKCPEKFTYQGKTYTPQTFAQSLGIDADDYVSFTSYTHHPFWTSFAVEVQDNWRNPLTWNVPLDDMMRIIDNAVMNGYTVAWGGDVSEEGFTRWLKLTKTEKKNVLDSLGCKVPEVQATQKLRQERFDNWELTDDHGMLIYGIAKDQNGKEYYMVKNSWGETGDYKGIWYMTKNFIANNTMDFVVNKNAVPKDIRKKLGI